MWEEIQYRELYWGDEKKAQAEYDAWLDSLPEVHMGFRLSKVQRAYVDEYDNPVIFLPSKPCALEELVPDDDVGWD